MADEPLRPLPHLSERKVNRLTFRALRHQKKLLYIEDRAAELQSPDAPTWFEDRDVGDRQKRLDTLRRMYEKTWEKYKRAMTDLYGDAWIAAEEEGDS